MSHSRISFGLLCIVLSTALTGCTGGTAKRFAVSGSVKFKGKPLDQGTIFFVSEDRNLGSDYADMIKDGTYSIPAAKGLLPGRYKVVISSVDPKNAAPDPNSLPGYQPVPKDRIQPKYNNQTTLTAEVKADRENTFDFEVD